MKRADQLTSWELKKESIGVTGPKNGSATKKGVSVRGS